MTNRCISSLIADITNEMPYELPGLPPINESPGQFAWEVIESPILERGKGNVLGITFDWLPREAFSSVLCQGFTLIHVESSSPEPFPSTPTLFSRLVDGC